MLPTGILPNLWRTYHRTHAKRPAAGPHMGEGTGSFGRGRQSAAQMVSVALGRTVRQLYAPRWITLNAALLAHGKTSSRNRALRATSRRDGRHKSPDVWTVSAQGIT